MSAASITPHHSSGSTSNASIHHPRTAPLALCWSLQAQDRLHIMDALHKVYQRFTRRSSQGIQGNDKMVKYGALKMTFSHASGSCLHQPSVGTYGLLQLNVNADEHHVELRVVSLEMLIESPSHLPCLSPWQTQILHR